MEIGSILLFPFHYYMVFMERDKNSDHIMGIFEFHCIWKKRKQLINSVSMVDQVENMDYVYQLYCEPSVERHINQFSVRQIEFNCFMCKLLGIKLIKASENDESFEKFYANIKINRFAK